MQNIEQYLPRLNNTHFRKNERKLHIPEDIKLPEADFSSLSGSLQV